MAQRPVCGNHVTWEQGVGPGTLGWVVGQARDLAWCWLGAQARGLGTQVLVMGDPARKSAQAEMGWGFGAQ